MRTRRRLAASVTAAMLLATSMTVGGAFALPAAADTSALPAAEETVPTAEGTPAAEGVPTEPAAATEPATERAESAEAAADEGAAVGVLAAAHGALWASVDLYRVRLSDGALMGTTKGHVGALAANVGSSATNVYTVTGTYGDDGATGLDATVVYKLWMDMPGAPDEDTWLKTRMYEARGATHAQCEIYRGDPRTGGTIMDPGAYTCATHQTQRFPNVRYTFAVEMNRYVESSGTVHTTGPVSLAGGRYYFEQPFQIPGAETVAANGTTTFSAVMREPDTRSPEGDIAKTRFSYRIQDTQEVGGVLTTVPTKYYVAGIMSRTRSGTTEAVCWIFDVSPEGSSAWRDIPPAKAAPFACKASWDRVDSGNAVGTFIVSKRDITVIPASQGPRQGDLFRDVCSVRPDDCDLRLATAVSTAGEPRALTGKWGNPHGKAPESHLFKFESKQSVTTTFGSELTLGVEGGAFGLKYKAEIKASFEYEVATETTIADEQHVEIEPGQRAFVVGAPTIVHTEGDIYVLLGDRLFLLQGVIADFPLAGDNTWNYWVEREDIPGWTPGVGGVQNPPLAGVDPVGGPAAGGAAGASGSGAGSGSLAQTGGSADAVLIAVAALLTLGGALLVVRRRRAHRNG